MQKKIIFLLLPVLLSFMYATTATQVMVKKISDGIYQVKYEKQIKDKLEDRIITIKISECTKSLSNASDFKKGAISLYNTLTGDDWQEALLLEEKNFFTSKKGEKGRISFSNSTCNFDKLKIE